MASNFDRWEKDPFFSAAEEVQVSSDRMESAYRLWIHESKNDSSLYDSDELRRDLYTALGTAKWQLEEFERAVRSSYLSSSAEDARIRHSQFIIAIENRVSTVENALKESVLVEGKITLPWVQLDEGERDELALFLSGTSVSGDRVPMTVPPKDEKERCTVEVPDCSPNSSHSADRNSQETKKHRLHGHRRNHSAGACTISISDEDFPSSSASGRPDLPPPTMPSFSGFLRTFESVSKLKWSKNSFRKWKGGDRHQAEDTVPLRDVHACYERSKSCLDNWDDSYDKQLYGWFGTVQRQLQRSQYQIQYGRPIQVTCWVVLVLFLIVSFVLLVI